MMDVHRSSGQISQPTQTVTEKPSAPVASPTAPLLQSVTVSKAKNTKKRRTSSSSSSETDNKEENKKKKKKPEKTKTKSKKAKEETPALDDSIEDELAIFYFQLCFNFSANSLLNSALLVVSVTRIFNSSSKAISASAFEASKLLT